MILKDKLKQSVVIRFFKKHLKKTIFLCILLSTYYFCLPEKLFNSPTSTVVESRGGNLLGAKIAKDGQWRFPEVDSIPFKFKTCLIQFEDAYFYKHPGFNPVSIIKAMQANITAGKTVRGGSTLTQQVVRLSRKKKRSYWEKSVELIWATRLELRYSKEEILKLYTSNAPFGGNVVGLEVAAWRYYGLQPHQLSWAESATLAVLPNAPSLIYPGKNQNRLLHKRNRLLQKLWDNKVIDSTTFDLALLEDLPKKPYALPKTATHFLQFVDRKENGNKIKSSIDEVLQNNVNTIVEKHHQNLRKNEVHNAAVLVLDVKTKEVLSYVGNTNTDKSHQKDVDMVQANRSTGSTIKPILYAAMLDAGELLPGMLVADVPTQIAGYTPENFNENYSGAIPAKIALSRSLNIPAVRLLQSYGLQKFRDQLDVFELGGLNKSADHYGLTLILGGAESNLWDLCKTYANLASTLNHFNASSSEYYSSEFTNPIFKTNQGVGLGEKSSHKTVFDAASIYLTFEAMKEVNRPEGNESWKFFDSSKEIAWKTGTSFGNKDAWAIGITTDYVVGIWVGNADGEGRPNVTGLTAAAPILFDVFDVLPISNWFQKPFDEFTEIAICAVSGYLAKDICPKKKIDIPNKKNYIKPCGYHQLIQLEKSGLYRVNSSCADLANTISKSWFSLPPLMEYYYKNTHPSYKSIPEYRNDCVGTSNALMEFIYPLSGVHISLPKNFEGKQNEMVVKLAHKKPETEVYWYIDDQYTSQTKNFHELAILPKEGKHTIMVVDALGNQASVSIVIE